MRTIFLDTDIGPDCDDAAALALLNLYAKDGIARVAGVTHCTSSPYGVGAIRAIDAWYGHDFPVGTTARRDFLTGAPFERYNKALAETVAPYEAREAVSLMREALWGCPDGSVCLTAIGPLGNVASLLRSRPDEVCPLDGVALAARKCERLVLMAGCFTPDAPHCPRVEWNIEMDVDSARTVAENWPRDMFYCGWEMGVQAPCGGIMARTLPDNHPVRRAYALHNEGKDRPSWDLLTVRYACLGEDAGITAGEPGYVSLGIDGETRFTPDPSGRHYALRFTQAPERVTADMDALLTREEDK